MRSSGAQLRDTRLVGQPLADDGAQALVDRGVVVQIGEAAEEEHLLDGLAPPAPIQVQLDEQEVEVRIGGS